MIEAEGMEDSRGFEVSEKKRTSGGFGVVKQIFSGLMLVV
jgi:hypothetical protein